MKKWTHAGRSGYHEAPAQPALVRAKARGRIEALLFETVLEQTYVNPGKQPLEMIYTFPLPSQAVFLGLDTLLGHERRSGAILARPDAEMRYEQALAQGDTPVMLELAEDGLLTANLGNLAPGEQIVVTLRWAQWLQREQGRIRAVIPTVVAQRFGSAALQPQQLPEHCLTAEYPLEVTVGVVGELARTVVVCETHRMTTRALDGRLELVLVSGAALDRDVVFCLLPETSAGHALRGWDRHAGGDHYVALAALQLPPAPERQNVALKILVDCSGSMGGDSIASARRALARVVQRLRPADQVSYSRFGDGVTHDVAVLLDCNEQTRRWLVHHVSATDASMGGTQMQQALEAVFELPGADGADVLLITDAQVWNAEAMVAAARRSGHRVFAIGVGSAPREGLLRQLASATGGACEFATPGESLEQAVDRSFSRIRQQPWRGLRCAWDVEPQHMRALPEAAFGGDTLLVDARFGDQPPREARLLAQDSNGRLMELAKVAVQPSQEPLTLARMLAASRLADIGDPRVATQVALSYQLLTRHTCCVLVHERAQDGKVSEPVALHIVPQMLAAGWGGTGTVLANAMYVNAPAAEVRYSTARVRRHARVSAPVADVRLSRCLDVCPDLDIEIPAYLRKESKHDAADAAHVSTTVQRLLDALATGATRDGVLSAVDQAALPQEVRHVLDQLQELGFTAIDAWLVWALWMLQQPAGATLKWRGVPLRALLSDTSRPTLEAAFDLLDRAFGPTMASAADGSTTMMSRLKRLLSVKRV